MIKLYILVRTDLASMNAGRTAAQATHAANYFVKAANELKECLENEDDPFIKNFDEWESDTPYGCGTVIILDGGSMEDIYKKRDEIQFNYLTGIFVDPEYTIQDGNFTHVLKDVPTCAFAFQYDDEDTKLKDLKLYGKD